MSRNDNRRGRNRNWNTQKNNNQKTNQKNTASSKERVAQRHFEQKKTQIQQQMKKDLAETEVAIRAFKTRATVCELCGQAITDLASAMANRGSGNPVHFDCIVKKLSEHEHLSEKDRLTYIGNGKFAVLHFENPHDMRHFSIQKEIEWENRDSERSAWRDEMAGLFSQVK